jgi:phosphate:Na+ symporter
VLLVAALAQLGVIAPPVALGLVLGANLGSGTLGMLSTLRSPPEARRVTLGNFLFKLIGVVIAIPLVNPLLRLVESMALDAGQEVVAFHLLFNLGIALTFIFFTDRIARVAERLLPTAARPATTRRSRATSIRPRSTRRRSRSPTPRARRSASATRSSTC